MKQPPAPVWLSLQRPPRATGGGGGGGGGDGAAAVSGCGGLLVHPPSAAKMATITAALIAVQRRLRHPFLKLIIALSTAQIAYQNVPQKAAVVRPPRSPGPSFTSWSE